MKPISKTAFYCCGIRMLDAASSNPICNDTYAQVFMNEDGLRILEPFKNETRPNAANVARHRIIDDLLREELLKEPEPTIIIIGAGFDSRGFRLHGGKWIELDEPQVIAYKNERLPATSSTNDVRRIPINFSTDSLAEKLAAFAPSSPVVVVIEGVFMYLEEGAITHLLQTLRKLFPQHKLLCDLMNEEFFENFGRQIHDKISDIGAFFRFTPENPEEIFLRNGYRTTKKISIVEKSVVYGSAGIPEEMLESMLPTLPSGYSIHVFETE